MRQRRGRVLWVTLVALVLGAFIGLLLGWQVFPVKWTDTDPVDLRLMHKSTYVLAVADSFVVNSDAQLAQDRLAALTDADNDWQDVSDLVGWVADTKGAEGDDAAVVRLGSLAEAVKLYDPQPMPVEAPSALGWVPILIYAGLFLLGLALLIYTITRAWEEPEPAGLVPGSQRDLASEIGSPTVGMPGQTLVERPAEPIRTAQLVLGDEPIESSVSPQVSLDDDAQDTQEVALPPAFAPPPPEAEASVSSYVVGEWPEADVTTSSLRDEALGEELVHLVDEELGEMPADLDRDSLPVPSDEAMGDELSQADTGLELSAFSELEDDEEYDLPVEPLGETLEEATRGIDESTDELSIEATGADGQVVEALDDVLATDEQALVGVEDQAETDVPDLYAGAEDDLEADVLGDVEAALAQRESDLAGAAGVAAVAAAVTAPDDVTEDASLASNEPAVEHDRAEFPDPVVEAAQPQEKVETDHEPESIQFAPIAVEESAPSKRLAQFESEYIYGDDDFDSSFSVDSESREFLGEVGMGTSDLLAADDVQKVDAFEVWLFDKQEIVTKSKFVVSDYALQHEGLRSGLEAKGDLVPARVGEQIVLEAGLLRLVATIRDLHYQPDEQFPDGVFAHLKVDLAVDLIG